LWLGNSVPLILDSLVFEEEFCVSPFRNQSALISSISVISGEVLVVVTLRRGFLSPGSSAITPCSDLFGDF